MPIDQQRVEEADYLANKLGALIKETRSDTSQSDKIKIALQVAQFIVVGVIGTGIAVYGERFKEESERSTRVLQMQNEKVLTALRETETKTTQAKVVQEIMPFLFDKDETKPKAAVLIISRFIDAPFALQIADLVNNAGAKAAADQIQTEAKPMQVPANGLAATSSGATKSGWVYLGRYDGTWTSWFFEFPRDKSPDELARSNAVINLTAKITSANLRKEPMRQQDPSSGDSVIGVVRATDRLRIDRVEPRLGSTSMWAYVSVMPH